MNTGFMMGSVDIDIHGGAEVTPPPPLLRPSHIKYLPLAIIQTRASITGERGLLPKHLDFFLRFVYGCSIERIDFEGPPPKKENAGGG